MEQPVTRPSPSRIGRGRAIAGAAASLLLVPYLAWVTLAGFLNHAVWRLNP